MGIISDMETVNGREIGRLILLVFILFVLFISFIALLFFLFIYLGLLDKFNPPFYAIAGGAPLVIIGGIFFIIPFWLFLWWFMAKYNFGKKIFYK